MTRTRRLVPAALAFVTLAGAAVALDAQGSPNRDSLAYLSVVSSPTGQLLVDDSIVGNTPASIAVREGKHRVKIVKSGYLPYETRIEILGGERLRLTDIVLKKKL